MAVLNISRSYPFCMSLQNNISQQNSGTTCSINLFFSFPVWTSFLAAAAPSKSHKFARFLPFSPKCFCSQHHFLTHRTIPPRTTPFWRRESWDFQNQENLLWNHVTNFKFCLSTNGLKKQQIHLQNHCLVQEFLISTHKLSSLRSPLQRPTLWFCLLTIFVLACASESIFCFPISTSTSSRRYPVRRLSQCSGGSHGHGKDVEHIAHSFRFVQVVEVIVFCGWRTQPHQRLL